MEDEKAFEDKALELVGKGAPWRRDIGWPIIAVEALVLIAIGIYVLVDKDGASDIILQLIGAVLLATSILLGYGAFRRAEAGLGFYDAFRAGVGATAGAIAVAVWWSDYIDKAAQRQILGWALVVYTVLHLVGLLMVRGWGNIRISTIVIALLTLVLGVVLLTGDDTTSSTRITTFGIILLVGGIALAGLAFYLYSKASDRTVSAASA